MTFSTTIENLENLVMNSSFLFLLVSMVFYWIYTFFKEKTLFEMLGKVAMICANFSLFSLLVLRWKESGHFPLSNLYESLIFLSWAFTTIHLILENITKISFLGSITSPSALLTNAFATFSLPSDMKHSAPLVPALQSNWLMMHVTVMIVSYAALICGSLLAIAFLIVYKTLPESAACLKKDNVKNKQNFAFSNDLAISTDSKLSYLLETSDNNFETNEQMRSLKKVKLAEILDNLSYRILGLGFPFLTIGILSGAVWANEAWGSYWSWDPKETWALLTWLVFAIYLHTRFSRGWSGERPALIASLGFIVVWICYLGVNLIGEGLHSYGWMHS